jgi:hypothetical protein
MATISEVAKMLDVGRTTVKDWTEHFEEYLSLTASRLKGQPRQFNEADIRVLALIADHWEDSPDFEYIYAMLNSGDHNEDRYAEFAQVHTPVFEEMPEGVDETWEHGVMIGGMAMYNLPQVAKSYKLAADALVERALSKHEAQEIHYPIIFLYRHSLELYLKAMLKQPPADHDLNTLIELLQREAGKQVPSWIEGRVRDFHEIDRQSDAFRYATGPDCDELWVDLHRLKAVMDRLAAAFDHHIAATRPHGR